MGKTYYDSTLTDAQIQQVLDAIDNILTPSNDGKVLAISGGTLEARSVQWGGGGGYPEPTGTILLTENGLHNVKDYAEANVQVQGGSDIEVIPLSVTENNTYTAPAGKAYSPVTVNVSGGGGGLVYVPYNPEYEQGAVNGTVGNSYAENKTSSITRIRPVDIVDVSEFLNDNVLFVWDESQYDITIQQYGASGYLHVSSAWHTKPWTDTISQPNIVIVARKKGEAAITPSEFASVNLKLISLTKSVF